MAYRIYLNLVEKDYYTYSHYFDTRHNDTLAIYFKLINKNFNSSTLKKWEHVYTNYMVYTYKNMNSIYMIIMEY